MGHEALHQQQLEYEEQTAQQQEAERQLLRPQQLQLRPSRSSLESRPFGFANFERRFSAR